MAKTIFIVACVLLSSAFQVSEGRQLRLREKQLLTVMTAYKAVDSDQPLVPEAPAQVVNAAQPPPPPPPPSGHVDNFRPTNPGHSPGAGHSLQLQTSSAHLVKKDASTTHDHDNNSHKTATDDGVVAEAPSPNPNATRPPPPTRRADDFKPTTPGHSPGAGHSIKT